MPWSEVQENSYKAKNNNQLNQMKRQFIKTAIYLFFKNQNTNWTQSLRETKNRVNSFIIERIKPA